jgi:hypothetical protein
MLGMNYTQKYFLFGIMFAIGASGVLVFTLHFFYDWDLFGKISGNEESSLPKQIGK